jgi:sacsin
MASLQFVPTGSGEVKAPNKLFNPNKPYVSDLFGDQFVFPCGPLAVGEKYGKLLVQYIGLRELQDITANELLQLASHVAAIEKREMGQALLKVLISQYWAQILLKKQVYWGRGWIWGRNLMLGREALATIAWMPVIKCCPEVYPVSMPWKGSSALCLPSNVAVASDEFPLEKLQLLVGSQLAILDYEQPLSHELIQLLSCVTCHDVYQATIKQLFEAHKQWTVKPMKKGSAEKFDRMLKELFCTIGSGRCRSLSVAEIIMNCLTSPSIPSQWVWLDGSRGFIQPQQLAVSSTFPLSLEPWLFTVEHYHHLAQCTDLLLSHGMKTKFEEEDILSVLSLMKTKYDRDSSSLRKIDKERDLKLAIAILNWVTRDKLMLSGSLQTSLLVPVHREDNMLELAPCSELMYCDVDWLRQGNDAELDEYRLIHRQISPETAYKLGVPSLSNRLAPSEELPFEQLGPHESLTLRIKNILKEYKDDAGVFKEILQNADDAGATEVKFLIDWREHDKSSLLSPGMSKCQGPALWAYNNSVFSDDDFVNIAKLAAATKQSKLEKIGRFGLGFTSVYHMTDVPSFVSRQFVVVFDPHKSHLGNHIRNPSQPGIKIDFVKRPVGRRFHDQFCPYTGVFGCNLEESSVFEGTLFRFPFRTREQAALSEIKSEPYDEDRVQGGLETLKSICGKLLIFLHHVTSIQVFELECEASSPSEMKQILSVQSKMNPVGNAVITHQQLLMSSCRQVERGGHQCCSGSASIQEISCCGSETELVSEEKWLVCSEASKGPAFKFSCNHGGKSQGLVPFAAVAVGLHAKSLNLRPVEGETFCFLPLSTRTGLPFHVNALFSVLSNRRGIWWHGTEETSVSGRSDVDAEWNKQLITDCLIQACMSMLKQLSMLLTCTKSEIASYYSLWPKLTELYNPAWHTLVIHFYATIVNSDERVFFTSTFMPSKSIALTDCVILLESVTKALPPSELIMKEFCSNYVQLPGHILDGLRNASNAMLGKVTVNEEQFIVNWFAPNISGVIPKVRDELLLAILSLSLTTHAHLVQYLTNLCIIPCCPDGMFLQAPIDLIDPKCTEAKLYLEEEKKFPFERVCQTDEAIVALKKLGMRSTGSFTWGDVVERCRTVKELERVSHEQAEQRARAIIQLMDSLCENEESCSAEELEVLREVPFMITARRPRNYPVQWYADQHPDQRVVSVGSVYTSKFELIVGSQGLILPKSLQVRKDVASLLCLNSSPPLSMVTKQLDLAITNLQEPEVTKELLTMIEKIYKELLFRYRHREGNAVACALANKAWIVVDGHAMKADQLAFKWEKRAKSYLSVVPSHYSYMRELLVACGVQETFKPSDFVMALRKINEEAEGKKLSNELQKVANLIISEFCDLNPEQLKTFRGESEVPLLSEDNRLLPASQLAYNDAPWMKRRLKRDHVYVHRTVARELAQGLGVKLVREKTLDLYARDIPGRPFGQSEPLTERLKNILRQYPAGEEILKELLQNADDAGATELHVIFDKRQYKTRHVFSDEWQCLQGPAICVYNNRPFAEADIEGIQNLGRGSKSDDPSLTGQYGIGFNAVYHLTDCPSFLSDNKILCVLDPQYRYVPGANAAKPGRLFDTTEELWSDFGDIWDCFKSIHGVTLEGGTLFRLPLRTAKMAKTSQISDTHFDSGKVEKLLQSFEKGAPNMLLFLNSVTCIKLSVISETSDIINSYEVKANLSCRAQEERLKVAKFVAESKGKPTSNITCNSVFYELELCENSKSRGTQADKWLVHQTVGIPHNQVADCSSIDGSKMGLLPRAGIAAPIEHCLDRKKTSLFCFLPLPVTWELPVQMNGHFAVQTNRRGLWEDSQTSGLSDKQKWNEDLIKFVLAPTYCQFLLEARSFVIYNVSKDNSNCDDLEKRLDWFHGLLPRHFRTKIRYLHLLLKELYCYILRHNCPLLAFTRCPFRSRLSEEQEYQMNEILPAAGAKVIPTLRWLEVNQRTPLNLLTAYFRGCYNDFNPVDSFLLETLLLYLGFPIVSSPSFLFSCLREANNEADIEHVSPQSVLLFLKQYRTEGASCCLQLGHIEDTVFKTVRAAELVLRYILRGIADKSSTNSESTAQPQSQPRESQLDGVPLLVTDDNQLMEFSTSSPAFHSRYSDLLPKQRDLFVNKVFYSTLSGCDDSVLKKLSPSDLVRHLPDQDVFPKRWQKTDEYYENWTPSLGPSKKWIETLWSFLKTETEDINKALECLKNWPIILVGGGKMLIPPSLSHTVFWSCPNPFTAFRNIFEAIQELGAVAVDKDVLNGDYGVSESLSSWFAKIENPESVLKVLQYLYTKRPPETTSITHAEIILKYFEHSVRSKDSLLVSGLKRLPLFETVQGTLSDLLLDSFTLSPNLCDAGAAVWMAEANCTLVKWKSVVQQLYKELGLNNRTDDEVYVNYILPCFPKMSQDDRIKHLVRLTERCRRSGTDAEPLKNALRITCCFNRQGVPRKVCEFYDPNVRLFTLMLPALAFPSTPPDSSVPGYYRKNFKSDWLPFLRSLGLKTTCSKEEFLGFGERLEKETLNWRTVEEDPADYKQWKEKSKEMINHLTKNLKELWSDAEFMQNVSKIRFLPSHPVDGKLEQLAVPFYKQNSAARYSTSYSEGVYYTEDNAKLCWTSKALVHQHGIVSKREKPFRDAIGIQESPNLECVLDHLKLLVESAKTIVAPNRELDQNTVDLDLLSNILSLLYKYLSECISDTPVLEPSPFADLRNSICLTEGLNSEKSDSIVESLSNYSCIFLPDKRMFVKPQQVVFSLKEEIYPYLFQLPRNFACYDKLLKLVGVDEKLRPFHCARVLESLKQSCGDEAVTHPQDQKALQSVVRLLFKKMKRYVKPSVQTKVCSAKKQKMGFTEQDVEIALSPLYLPSRDGVMKSSTELVYLDRPNLEGLVGSLQHTFLIGLNKCGLSSLAEETVNLLPASLRPRLLSELTEEVLDPECLLAPFNDQNESVAVATWYQERYSSRLFVQAVRSIYIHEKRTSDLPDDLEAGLFILQNDFLVKCVPQIRTCLRLLDGGSLVKVDDVNKCCFLERSGSKATLYLDKTSALDAKESGGNDIELHGFVARELQELLHTQLSEFAMMTIVSCPPNLIATKLKKLNILFEYEGEEPQLTGEPFDYQPGMSLLAHHIPLLRQSPLGYRYNVNEWVAYEEKEGCFVYAIILHQETLTSDDATDSELTTRYCIDVGKEEPKSVSVLSLYAFMCNQEREDKPGEKKETAGSQFDLEVSQNAPDANASTVGSGPETLTEKISAVREQLKRIWQLPGEDRRKAVKRLYLQWHPDKNEDSDADEVFKFIMNEIQRLERVIDSASSYSSNYDSWNSYARRWGRRSRSRPSYSYRPPPTFESSSQPRPSPDRSMGRMFLEQAKADLSVAEAVFEAGDRDPRRYAAVCFHCHEVVEKALKGLLFIYQGISYEHQRKHNIGYFLRAADFAGCPSRLKKNAERINVKNYYLDTRYPDQRHVVPASAYSREEAEEALEAARAVAEDSTCAR